MFFVLVCIIVVLHIAVFFRMRRDAKLKKRDNPGRNPGRE
jgi:hypothetical protein